DHPSAGALKYPGAPYKLSRTPWKLRQGAPLLGQHNEEIYCKRLGYSREELVRLRKAGAI
ncbi:MAG: CoA transferase, partial [Dehalococcoidia bacterium]|nr:CoA transferase [Dehalococcoidia bacterium]